MSYDVYGIGAALLDIEYAVDDAFLADHGVVKGHMTLIDETRLKVLVDALAGFSPKRMCGGSAANTVYAVQAFGGDCYYSCRVAGDDAGAYFLAEIAAAGVDVRPHDPERPGQSGRCLVLVTGDAERSMNTFLGASELLDIEDVEPPSLARSRYAYIEGYLASSETGRAAAIRTREIAAAEGVRTSLTLSDPSMVESFRDDLLAMLGNGVHALFCNEEEALQWTGADRVDIAANELADIAPLVFMTLGGAGSLVVAPSGRREVAAFEVAAVDTTGAGDIYAGACLYALCSDGAPSDAARFGNYAAAQLVAQVGPRLPDLADYRTLRERFPG